jgi:hypothetical protein
MRISVAVLCLALLAACEEKPPVEPAPAATPAAEPVTLAQDAALEKLAGRWQSLDDPKSILVVTKTQWISEYHSDQQTSDVAEWKVFSAADAPEAAKSYTIEAGKTYLEVKGPVGPQYFEMGDIEADAFDMFYLGRGNRLAYKRLN